MSSTSPTRNPSMVSPAQFFKPISASQAPIQEDKLTTKEQKRLYEAICYIAATIFAYTGFAISVYLNF